MTFLALCKRVRAEMGMSGTGPVSVQNQTGQTLKVINAVMDADNYVQSLWTDWDFLWKEFSTVTTAGNRAPDVNIPTDIGSWNEGSFVLDAGTDDAYSLEYVTYAEFRDTAGSYKKVDDDPTGFTIKPDRTLLLDPVPIKVHALTAEYWVAPTSLSEDTDVSVIPTRFERIIIARAKLFLAEQEDAPEIMQASTVEYDALLMDLESDQLPGRKIHRSSSSREDIVVQPQ